MCAYDLKHIMYEKSLTLSLKLPPPPLALRSAWTWSAASGMRAL